MKPGMSLAHHMPAMRHPDLRRLLLGGAASGASLWALLLGNAWIVYKLSDSSLWVGVTTFASMSPSLFAPFAGVVSDRFERSMLARVSRTWSFLTTAILFLVVVTGLLSVWLVVVVALLQGIVRSLQIAADQALLANVVPPEDLGSAVALATMAQQGSRILGIILAGPLLALLGVEGAYSVAVAFALLSYLSVIRIQTNSWGSVESLSDLTASLHEGLRYVWRTRPVLALFFLVFFHCTLTMSFDAMLPAFAEDELHAASSGFTIIVFGIGTGAFFGTLLLVVFGAVGRGPLFLATGIISGLSPMMLALSSNVWSAAASAMVIGASQAMYLTLSAIFLQEVVPDGMRGRVMSLFTMSGAGVMAIANLGFGAMVDSTGARVLLWGPGSLFIVIMVVSIGFGGNLRRIYRTGRIVEPALRIA